MFHIEYKVDYIKLVNDLKDIIKQIQYADRFHHIYTNTTIYVESNIQKINVSIIAAKIFTLLKRVDGIKFNPNELCINVMDILKLITYANIDKPSPSKEYFIYSNSDRIQFLSIICIINDLTIELRTKPNKNSIVSKILDIYRIGLKHLTSSYKRKIRGKMDSFTENIREQYERYLDICIAMEQLKLPTYIILWITNEINCVFDGNIHRFYMLSDSQKIRISENVRSFHNKK